METSPQLEVCQTEGSFYLLLALVETIKGVLSLMYIPHTKETAVAEG